LRAPDPETLDNCQPGPHPPLPRDPARPPPTGGAATLEPDRASAGLPPRPPQQTGGAPSLSEPPLTDAQRAQLAERTKALLALAEELPADAWRFAAPRHSLR
jgi:hypothetical protein